MKTNTSLRPEDVLIALKLAVGGGDPPTSAELAKSLHLGLHEVEDGIERLTACQLYNGLTRRVVRASLRNLLVHGIRHVFPAPMGPVGLGMPTASSCAPLATRFFTEGEAERVVWPRPDGSRCVLGRTIEPLCDAAPEAADEDPALYELLALVDALRVGRAREREMAKDEIEKRLSA